MKKAIDKAYVPAEYAIGTYALFFVFWWKKLSMLSAATPDFTWCLDEQLGQKDGREKKVE